MALNTQEGTEEHEEQKDSSKYLRLNLSGQKFEILKRTVHKPCSPLREANGRTLIDILISDWPKLSDTEKKSLVDDYCPETETFYFDRSPKIFDSILDFYRFGTLHRPLDVCPQKFFEEVNFWGISKKFLSECCHELFDGCNRAGCVLRLSKNRRKSTRNRATSVDNAISVKDGRKTSSVQNGEANSQLAIAGDNSDLGEVYPEFQGVKGGKLRRKVWIFLEDADSSLYAKIYCVFSISVVIISVLVLILGSLPDLQSEKGEPLPALWIIEDVCVACFTFEYVMRLLVTPERCKFMREAQNVVDILTIIPFYIELLFMLMGMWTQNIENIASVLLTMRILRVFRVARVFKLARYSDHLKHFGESLKASKHEFGMLLLYLSISVLLFSTAIYYMEKEDPNTPFTSIPTAFWWCVVTMTTVGYGDLIPTTLGGKLVASLATISGVIVLAYPITMIVNNFNRLYHTHPSAIKGDSGNDEPLHPEHRFLRVHSVAIV